MTRMGAPALERIERDGTFVKGLHSIGDLDPEPPLHHAFPRRALDQELRLGLRRQRAARQEVPRAAHRELAGAQRRLARRAHADRRPRESRRARRTTSPRAFPSACGKTNLAMLIPPDSMPGWKVWTRRRRHRLAAPGHGWPAAARSIPRPATSASCPARTAKTNRNAYDMIQHDTIFTNVALTADNQPWWEGSASRHAGDRLAGHGPTIRSNGPAAHPNSRFTVSAKQNPIYSPLAEDAAGRADLARSCSAAAGAKSRRWCTRRATGSTACSSARRWRPKPPPPRPAQVGVVRRDPMAMKPFCGYNFGDYWAHWLYVRRPRRRKLPQHLPRQLVPPATRTASSCGRASATTCACCAGSSTAAPAASSAQRDRRSATCRARQDLDRQRASTSTRATMRGAAGRRPGGVAQGESQDMGEYLRTSSAQRAAAEAAWKN